MGRARVMEDKTGAQPPIQSTIDIRMRWKRKSRRCWLGVVSKLLWEGRRCFALEAQAQAQAQDKVQASYIGTSAIVTHGESSILDSN